MRHRLAFLATHPIQYQAPLFRKLAAHPEIDLTVYFCSRTGLEERFDSGFGQTFKWDLPLLEGYRYKFLPNLFDDNLTRKGLINPTIIREIWSRNFDALFIHGWAFPTALLALGAGIIRRLPVYFRVETNLLGYDLNGVKRNVRFLLLRRILKAAAGFLVIGSLNRAFYHRLGVPANKLFFAPYAVDNGFFMTKAAHLHAQKAELKRKNSIPVDLPIILFCGKLTPVKDPQTLLTAFHLLRRSTDCALVWVGDGPFREVLQGWIKENNTPDIYFTGFRNQTQLPEFYALADIFVLPSIFEPWGLVVNEAMCFGLPVIVSDQVGCGPDLVWEGRNGFTFPAGDAAALAACLERLVADPSLRDRMGQESLKIIQTWDYDADVEGILRASRARSRQTEVSR